MTTKPFKEKWDKVKSNKRVFYPLIGGIGVIVTAVAVAVPLVVTKKSTSTQGENKTGILEIGDLPPASAPDAEEDDDSTEGEVSDEGLRTASVVSTTNVLDQLDNKKKELLNKLSERFPDQSVELETATPDVVGRWKNYIKARSIYIEEVNSAVSERQLTFLQSYWDIVEREYDQYESIKNVRDKLKQIISSIPDEIDVNEKIKYHASTIDIKNGRLYFIHPTTKVETQIVIKDLMSLIPNDFEWELSKPVKSQTSTFGGSVSATLSIRKNGSEITKPILFTKFKSGNNVLPQRVLTSQQTKNIEKLKETKFEDIANIPNSLVRNQHSSASVSRMSSGQLASGVNYEVLKWDTSSPSAIEYEVKLWVNNPEGEERIISGFVGGFVDWQSWLAEKKKSLRKQIIKDTTTEAPDRHHLQLKEVRDAWGIFSDMFREYDIAIQAAADAESLMNVATNERKQSIINAYNAYLEKVKNAKKLLPQPAVNIERPIDKTPAKVDPRPESEEEYYRRRAQRTGEPNSHVRSYNSPDYRPLVNMKN